MKTDKKEKNAPTYDELKLPYYKNSRVVARVGDIELDFADAVKAAVLGGLNVLLVSEPGTGKTQLILDLFNWYFGGNKNGVWFKARPDTEVSDAFVKLNPEEYKKELTQAVDKIFYIVDEINRGPGPVQDQFMGLGDGTIESPDGLQTMLGRDGYSVLISSANMNGNGDLGGTWELDRALLNRLHITLDLDYYDKTFDDEISINKEGSADPKVRAPSLRDISEKIMAAWNEINKLIEEPGLESEIVLMYLGVGLKHCEQKGLKTSAWPHYCQECDKAGNLCEKIKAATPRTRRAVLKYSAALQYLAQLKAESEGKDLGRVDAFDLVFNAFKLASAYHGNLNPYILQGEYYEENARMMEDVVIEMQKEFNELKGYISLSLEFLRENNEIVTQFVNTGEGVYPAVESFFDDLAAQKKYEGGGKKLMEEITGKSEIVKPYEDNNFSWFPKLLEKYQKTEAPKK